MAEKLSPKAEAALTQTRIIELELNPVPGKFDAAHLKEIHRQIFQDVQSNEPGQQRLTDTTKNRELENGHRYLVPYAPAADIDGALNDALADIDPKKLAGATREEFSARMTKLYGDLDYAHPFAEGNSRALRVFTSQVAFEAGFDLDWSRTNQDAASRDALYIARDKEVFKRAFPGLDEQRASTTNDRVEYEAYERFLRPFEKAKGLEAVVVDASRKHSDLDAAADFKSKAPAEALAKHPHLAGAYATLAAIDQKARADGYGQESRREVAANATERIAAAIEQGAAPAPSLREREAEQTRTPSVKSSPSLER